MFRRDPPASAMETNVGRKNPRWDEKEEDDAAEEDSNERIRVFYPRLTCFIYMYTLMGLRRGKVQSTSMGFYILLRVDDKKSTADQEQRYVQKVGKYLSRSATHLVTDSGAHIIIKSRVNIFKHKNVPKLLQETSFSAIILYFELIPENFSAIASGATPIGSTGRAPDKNKSTKGR
jgi:hypothetical protein